MLVCGEPSDDGVRQRRCDSCGLDRWGVDLNDSRSHRRLWRGQQLLWNYSPDIDACDEAQSLAAYGRLYNWYAVDDARGLCPAGWHVPTDGEWTELEDYITSQGFAGTEGTALKSTTGWYNNGNGTDDFGFSALPGGYRYSYGYFSNAGVYGFWWSSSPSGGNAWLRACVYYRSSHHRSNYDPRYGFSVRCLRDAD